MLTAAWRSQWWFKSSWFHDSKLNENIIKSTIAFFIKNFNFKKKFYTRKQIKYKLERKSWVKLSLHILKEMEMEEPDNQEDEYLDAFVALGGKPNKEGRVEAKLLIEIIKDDFELTINMEEYLNSVESSDSLDFYQFCVLLDASMSGNPSRFSSMLANRGFSVLQGSLFQATNLVSAKPSDFD